MAQRPDSDEARFRVPPDHAGERLDRVLHAHLAEHLDPPPSRAEVRAMIQRGDVRVDGRRCDRASRRVDAGQRIEASVDRASLREAAADRAHVVTLEPSCILYEDDALLAVDKPAGLPSHATRDPRRDHLLAAVERLLAARDGSPPPELRLAHRLDADTSGVVLLTKTPAATRALASAFAEQRVEKIYEAVVHAGAARLPREWTVESNLRWSRADRRMRAVRAGGDPARTDFRTLAQTAETARIEAQPRTGRTHQIRVHLAEAGTPILGDRIYGAHDGGNGADRLLLHSNRIELLHPLTEEPLSIQAALPF